MKFELVRVDEYFELKKGISYTSADLVDESETGLLTINAFHAGGEFKLDSEKPFGGHVKADFLLSDGDVLLAMTEQDEGLLASPLLIKMEHSPFSQLTYSLDVAKVVSKKKGMEPKFLYNVLRVPAFRIRAAYGDAGSTVQRLPYDALGELRIPCPSLAEQKAIVDLIDEIDEQIYVNSQLALTLEAIVNTVFKSWFIDFDPMNFSQASEDALGVNLGLSKLYPNTLVDSDLGLLPSGWTVDTVSDLLERLKYRPPFKSSEDFLPGDIPVIQQGEPMIAGYTSSSNLIEASKSSPVFVFGDHTCRMKLMLEPFIALPNTIALRSNSGNTYWAYHTTRDLQKFESYRRHWMELAIRKVAVPPQELIDHFEEFASSCWEQIAILERKAKLSRDLLTELIPQLLTGKVEVPYTPQREG